MYDSTLHAASVGGAKGLMTTLMQTNSTEVINKTSTIYEMLRGLINGEYKKCLLVLPKCHVCHNWILCMWKITGLNYVDHYKRCLSAQNMLVSKKWGTLKIINKNRTSIPLAIPTEHS